MAFHDPTPRDGGCEMVTSETRLGSSWTYCNEDSEWRCTIRRGGEEVVEHYCPRHYAAAKRRTRYDVVIDAEQTNERRS